MANELSKTEIKEIKISQNKIDEFSDEITNASELIENSMRVIKNVALSEHTINGDFEEWKKKQKIVRINLRKELNKSVKNSQILIKKTIQNTMSNIGDVVEDMTEETKKTIKPKKTFTPKLVSNAEKGIKLLGNKMLSEYDKTVANVYKLRNQEPLFESILKHTQTGIDKAPTKIYADGKEFSFKSYMEMNVRTTVRHEANELLFNASKMNGVVFYICSHFGDCAKDHADYQGKYYYDEDWESFGYNEQISKQISSYIKSNNLLSYQSVVYKEPFLTTRPNCRHSFRPVVLNDIIENAKTANQMLGEYKLIKNTYNDKNYVDLQQQRKNERAIRFYKTRLEENKLMLEKNPTDPKLIALIKKDKELIKKWQTKQIDLLNSNPILKRDYRRENNKILVQDLGAGYQLGLKIDGKNMYVKKAIKEPLTVKDITPSVKVEVKPEKIIVKEDAFPNAFYTNKKQKDNMDILIKHINEKENANPEVIKMFAKLKDFESLEKNGIPFKVKFGKNNAVGVTRKFTGEIIDSNIVLQDLTKNNTEGALHTNLHELGHLIDLYNRDEKNRWFTESFGNVKDILKKEKYSKPSEKILSFFKETKEKYNDINKKVDEEYKQIFNNLEDEYKNKKIDYFQWEKQWNKLIDEKNQEKDIQKRNLGVTGFEDIYDALSGGELRNNGTVTYGHGTKYYYYDNAKIEEIFANYVSLSVTKPELIKMLKDDKPELVNLLDNMIKKINEGK